MLRILIAEFKYNRQLSLILIGGIIAFDILILYYPDFEWKTSGIMDIRHFAALFVLMQYANNFDKQRRESLFFRLPVNGNSLCFVRAIWLTTNMIFAVILDTIIRIDFMNDFNVLHYTNSIFLFAFITMLAGIVIFYRDYRIAKSTQSNSLSMKQILILTLASVIMITSLYSMMYGYIPQLIIPSATIVILLATAYSYKFRLASFREN